MPEFREIGLDPAVQGVPVKEKLSVFVMFDCHSASLQFQIILRTPKEFRSRCHSLRNLVNCIHIQSHARGD